MCPLEDVLGGGLCSCTLCDYVCNMFDVSTAADQNDPDLLNATDHHANTASKELINMTAPDLMVLERSSSSQVSSCGTLLGLNPFTCSLIRPDTKCSVKADRNTHTDTHTSHQRVLDGVVEHPPGVGLQVSDELSVLVVLRLSVRQDLHVLETGRGGA